MNYKKETYWKYVRSLLDMSDTYCNEPWRTAHYDEVGKLGPCCTYRGKRPNFTKIDDYWSSEWLRDFREKLGTGIKEEGCFNCWRKEDRGEYSQRTDKNRRHGYIDKPQLEELFLSFGNICNKSCGICRPSRSHLIAKEYKTIPRDNGWLLTLPGNKTQKVLSDKKYSGHYLEHLGDYKSALESADTIYLDGGEPFIVSQCTEILEYLIANGMTHKKIKAGTNGSVTDSQLELLSKFKSVSFHLSIDGIEELYPVVRPPHEWQWFLDSQSRIQKYPRINITYACVIHAFNIHQLPRMVRYFIDQRRSHAKTHIFFSQINSNNHLEPSVVPVEVMTKTIRELKQIVKTSTNDDKRQVKQMIKHLETQLQKDDPAIKKSFDLYCDTFSKIKNINYGEFVPWIG